MIGRCLTQKPDLENRVLPAILARVLDTNPPIRRRAMKILKDIYLRSKLVEVKLPIAECLLLCINDHESSVAELAKKTFEELWINPSFAMLKENSTDEMELSPKAKMIIKECVGIVVQVVLRADKQADHSLNTLINTFLDPENKQVDSNAKVCKWMVQGLFDDLLEHVGDGDKVSHLVPSFEFLLTRLWQCSFRNRVS